MYRTHKSRILFVGPYVSNTRKTWLIIQLWKKHASEQQRRRHQRCQTPQRRTHWPLATKFFRTAESLTSPLCCRRALVNLITVDNVHATISKQVHYQSIISVAICHWLTTTSSECCSACGNKYSEVWLTEVTLHYTMRHNLHWQLADMTDRVQFPTAIMVYTQHNPTIHLLSICSSHKQLLIKQLRLRNDL